MVKYFQELLSFVVPPVVAVFVLGLFWKRANAHGAFAGLIAGLLMAVGLALDRKIYHWTPLARTHFLYVAPLIFSVSLLIIAVVSLATPPPEDSRIAPFVWKPQVFAEESRELAAMPW